ncbi:MAG TPA: AAA domain-containing protein, partial [Pyrinomonadaceae bacterium]|nr:AAA domain-containing protein [Pyrinomonadaceae bacterium]
MLQANDTRLDAEHLKNLITVLTGLSGWNPSELKTLAHCFAIEERQVFKSKKEKTDDPPSEETTVEEEDTKVLNSFFVDDLQKVSEAFTRNNCGAGIKSFLREREVSGANKLNLDDRKVLEEFVAPQYIPLGRWASDDEEYQSLMQQAGINLALSKPEQNGNLFSVNGPPGTGKSTLLRDIIAALMVERAISLTRFDNPHDAFTQIAEIPVSKGVKIPLFRLDSRIVGYEIVVASSNNTAVQNITQEIPGKDSIGQDYLSEAAYFQQVAENVFARNEKIQPWGMVAAVLGNADNRNKFSQRFWFDKPSEDDPDRVSFRSYLKYSDSVSLTDWKIEKTKFLELRNQVSTIIEQRQKYFNSLEEKRRLIKELENITRKIQTSQKELKERRNAARRVESDLSSVESERKENLEDIEGIKSSKPYFIEFWLAYIFKRSKVDEYNQSMENAQKEREQIKSKKKNLEKKFRLLETQIGEIERSLETFTRKYDLISEAKNANDKLLAVGKQNLDTEAFADEDWWNRDEKELQLRAPWLDKKLNKLRARLFLQAMKLHEVFIRVARNKISKNLNLWTNILGGNLPLEKNEYFRYLWQTFFLVVPVVSTTFASFGRMFADLGRESLGWLLIDEAGQAVPQAAVGAIWRAKNSVIVGDPLSI